MATGAGGHLPSMTMESLLCVGLTMRGARSEMLLCDEALPACMMAEINWYQDTDRFARTGPRDRCRHCYAPAADLMQQTGLGVRRLSAQLTVQERRDAQQLAASAPIAEIAQLSVDGVSVGEHALAGTLRFFARAQLERSNACERVLRRYLEAALLTYYATRRLLTAERWDAIVLNHGIYVPQGIIAETARQRGVRVVTWHPAYRRGCFIFSHHETYHHSLRTEPTAQWEDIAWDDAHRNEIEDYLRSRWVGDGDWIRFHSNPQLQPEAIRREIGIDLSRPTIGLLTNVAWDAQLHYPANAFADMLEWLIETIRYFQTRPSLQLLVRIHPAELTGTLPSRQPALDEIRKAFPEMPQNVFVIPPDSRLSTYVAMAHCNAVLIYGTKTGVELAAAGMPVIVAGEAWVRGKGVTLDATSREHYFQLLDELPLPSRLESAVQERALKYAYHFFFRRMIPLSCMEEVSGWPPFRVRVSHLADLEAGGDDGLDRVCQGILFGTPFIFPSELRSRR
ncbi:MAG: capsule biosynthesis protein [Burkholderiales bacterium]|nr:capsule biosynthesis protein [Burkholderiales bacterium]